ncbi:MAG: hypothetical protein IPM55_22085 [Acidobacteria bacterium]|nr:hypothetical protein [Acidobacteriota bacterium]
MNFRVIFNEAEWTKAVEAVASRTIRTFVFDTVNRMKVSFAKAKSGRFYKVSKRGRLHQASAPGEAPAILTGFLANSILTSFPSQTTGVITIGAEYAEYLERGTSRMAARPFVEPALNGALDQINRGGLLGRIDA